MFCRGLSTVVVEIRPEIVQRSVWLHWRMASMVGELLLVIIYNWHLYIIIGWWCDCSL